MNTKKSSYPAKIERFLDRDRWIGLMLTSAMSSPAKVVVTYLAFRLHIDDGELQVDLKTIGKGTNYGERHVRRLIDEAEAADWIKVTRELGCAHQYVLMVPSEVEQASTPDTYVQGDAEGPRTSDVRGDEGGPRTFSGGTPDILDPNPGHLMSDKKQRNSENSGGESPPPRRVGKKAHSHGEGRKKGGGAPPPVEETNTPNAATIKEAFKKFWALYPKQEDPLDAEKAFHWVVKTKKASIEHILASTRRYANERRGEPSKWTLKPARWLRAGGWANTSNTKTIDQHGNYIAGKGGGGNGSMEEAAAQLYENIDSLGLDFGRLQ